MNTQEIRDDIERLTTFKYFLLVCFGIVLLGTFAIPKEYTFTGVGISIFLLLSFFLSEHQIHLYKKRTNPR
jgi:hypothetical protein